MLCLKAQLMDAVHSITMIRRLSLACRRGSRPVRFVPGWECRRFNQKFVKLLKGKSPNYFSSEARQDRL